MSETREQLHDEYRDGLQAAVNKVFQRTLDCCRAGGPVPTPEEVVTSAFDDGRRFEMKWWIGEMQRQLDEIRVILEGMK